MEYELTHRTTYVYSEPVTVSHSAARMQPFSGDFQHLESFQLEIQPVPDRLTQRVDYFGNGLAVFSIRELHSKMEVVARSVVKVQVGTPPVPALSPVWTEVVRRFRDPVAPVDAGAYEFCMASPMIQLHPRYARWAGESFGSTTPLLVGVHQLMARMHREFVFDAAATDVATPLEDVWEKRRGVCQDFAHVGITCLRSLGLPARYVSGYLRTIPPEGKPRLQGADASHAWFSVFCPINGWVDFDPTNNLIPTDGHVRVAVGRDYTDVTPLCGVVSGGGAHAVQVEVDVVPLEEKVVAGEG